MCNDNDLCQGNDALGDSDGDGFCDDIDRCDGDDLSGDGDDDGICNNIDSCFGNDVFGDADNDIEMFRRAGNSVAMGQADDAVKQAASHVTTANTEDGVAEFIESQLL